MSSRVSCALRWLSTLSSSSPVMASTRHHHHHHHHHSCRAPLSPAPVTHVCINGRQWSYPSRTRAMEAIPIRRFSTAPTTPSSPSPTSSLPSSSSATSAPIRVKSNNRPRYIIVAGCGPHFKRVYHKTFRRLMESGDANITIPLILELADREADTRDYFANHQANSRWGSDTSLPPLTPLRFHFARVDRQPSQMDADVKAALDGCVARGEADGLVISTEPKAHHIFLKWAINNRIPVLMDKPISIPKDLNTSPMAAQQLLTDFLDCKQQILAQNGSPDIGMMCQRRYHAGYSFLFNYLRNFMAEFRVPISYIDIHHSDGQWNMPGEYTSREGHPYRYGYGKLVHSGYHFVDLYAWLVDLNREFCSPSSSLPSPSAINNGSAADPYFSIYSTRYRPLDALHQIPPHDIARLFNKRAAQLTSQGESTRADIPSFPSSFHITPQSLSSLKDITADDTKRMSEFGELDCYHQIQVRQPLSSTPIVASSKRGNGQLNGNHHDSRVITTGSLTLLQNGFSRRSWIDLPADPYKSNGRVRHEAIRIHIGPLLSIQVHNYESYEKTKPWRATTQSRWEMGGDTHFEVVIYRNADLVGGQALQRFNFGSPQRPDRDALVGNDSVNGNDHGRVATDTSSLSSSATSTSVVDLQSEARWLAVRDFVLGHKTRARLLDQELTTRMLSAIYTNYAREHHGHIPYSEHPLR